jgi:hypothetical protein
MRNAIVPSPCPCDPEVMTTHDAALDADHEHSREMLTATELVPPLGPNDRGELSKLGWQRVAEDVGDVTLIAADPPHADAAATSPNATTDRTPTRIDFTPSCVMHIRRQLRWKRSPGGGHRNVHFLSNTLQLPRREGYGRSTFPPTHSVEMPRCTRISTRVARWFV